VRGDRRPPQYGEVTHSVVVREDDARTHCERAREHGARAIIALRCREASDRWEKIWQRPRNQTATA
jgi:hypothetical protein